MDVGAAVLSALLPADGAGEASDLLSSEPNENTRPYDLPLLSLARGNTFSLLWVKIAVSICPTDICAGKVIPAAHINPACLAVPNVKGNSRPAGTFGHGKERKPLNPDASSTSANY